MKSCCCFCGLRTGGLILGYLAIIVWSISLIASLSFAVATVKGILLPLIVLACVILCLFGIHTNKRVFMLPHIILSWIGSVFAAILSVILVFLSLTGAFLLHKLIDTAINTMVQFGFDLDTTNIEKYREVVLGAIVAICIALVIISALMIYFTVVIQSLYISIGKASRDPLQRLPHVYQAPIVHQIPKVPPQEEDPEIVKTQF